MKLSTRLRKVASAAASLFKKQLTLSGVDSGRGWITLFSSTRDRNWQADTKFSDDDVLAFTPVYACDTLIASDVGKTCLRLMEKTTGGIWEETTSPAFSPLLRKPNHFQTRQQFIETWVLSKLANGNAYILKIRDNRQVVKALYVLDPARVVPLVAPDGSVFYQLNRDDLSKLPFDMPAIPANEIIHDRMECLYHPLVGVSPLVASYLPASLGLRIQKNSEAFFKNMSRPSGMLTAPGTIDQVTADRLKKEWKENFSGDKIGNLAVLGDALKYEEMTINAVDAQLVEQLKLSGEQICSSFHVPPYMVGVGPLPTYNNVQALNQQYYSQCLQKLFTAIEDLLDDGLGLAASGYRTEFELDDLLRMDSAAQAEALGKLVGAAIMAPNEARRRFNLKPVTGGESPLAQQQNFSLAALAKRDAKDDPFATAPAPTPPPTNEEPDPEEAREFGDYFKKAFA
ncbi:MAG: phage portal protein [Betaproteobacteria bacterium]|nr:phage portal protein [Betaproteobacteria bacterium]